MPIDKVTELKTHLEVLEKLRSLEKDARNRLVKEGMPAAEQKKWSGILGEGSRAIDSIETNLETILREVANTISK